MLWFLGQESCEILASELGFEPIPITLEGGVLTTGESGKSHHIFFLNKFQCSSLSPSQGNLTMQVWVWKCSPPCGPVSFQSQVQVHPVKYKRFSPDILLFITSMLFQSQAAPPYRKPFIATFSGLNLIYCILLQNISSTILFIIV